MLSLGEVQKWLENHCHEKENVVGGLVTLANSRNESPVVAARWPDGSADNKDLVAAAADSIRGRKSHFRADVAATEVKATAGNVVALPLQVGQRAVGAVALKLASGDAEITRVALAELQRAASELAREVLPTPASAASIDAATSLQLQAAILSRKAFSASVSAFANDAAATLHFDRVIVGFMESSHVAVVGISGSRESRPKGELAELAGAAMDEALEQDAIIVFPGSSNDVPRITLAHAAFVRRMGGSVFTIPMANHGQAFGAVTFVRAAPAAPTVAEIAQCEHVVAFAGPVLELKHAAATPWHKRAWKSAAHSIGTLRRPGHAVAKAAVATAAVAIAALTLIPVDYRVGAPARIEGAVQRALVAPTDGFLRQVNVRPGDQVKTGQVMAELAEDDLQLERRKWESELAQYENSASAALARTDRTQFVISQAKANEAQAQLDLVMGQLSRSRVVAPFDGVVIQGDLSQSIGAPVERGDVLMTVAPAGSYRVIVEVDERDIEDVQVGKAGQVALGAFEQSVPFKVIRITPMATARDGRNFFEVEGELASAPASLRPGSQGVGKIEAGERTLAWAWTHRLFQWARMTLWAWGA
ncbi:MAG TPA: HlyD family efflux transporter periplasmic adaptor subunit [Burkholderiales bacterium]|nr:HlyD family efflux transporter periplasmic adaptor subunit [Burkholderiales bacterium]